MNIHKKTEGLKSYYISSDSYTGFGNQWTKPVLTAIDGSGTQDRFYVMALEDFNPGTTYYWYNSAYGKLENTISTSTNDLGQGKTNTATMIVEWNKGTSGKYGAQNAQDMTYTKMGVTPGNYPNYGVKSHYWSSTQYTTNSAYAAFFNGGGFRRWQG